MMYRLSGLFVLIAALLTGVPTLHAQGSQATGAEVQQAQVDLNTATAAELEALPGVGPAMAARILEYRQKNGGFTKIEELMNVQGIGEKRFLDLKSRIVVTPLKAGQ